MEKSEITVNITYGNIKRDLKCQIYTTLRYIKKRCYDLFYPIKEDINIYYQNQKIPSTNLTKSIGQLFNNKNVVNLKIDIIPNTKNLFKKKLKSKKSNPNSSSNINKNSKSYDNKLPKTKHNNIINESNNNVKNLENELVDL